MFGGLLRRLWNRRKDTRRLVTKLVVRGVDSEGEPFECVSEDVSDSGIRLRFDTQSPSQLLGHQEGVPLEIDIREELPPVKVQAQLVWAYDASDGGAMSGWRFVRFKGSARRRLRHYLDRSISEAETG